MRAACEHWHWPGHTVLEDASLIPYLIIVYAAKYLVQIEIIRMLFIGFASIIWFLVYHLMLVRDSVFYIYISSFIEQKKES